MTKRIAIGLVTGLAVAGFSLLAQAQVVPAPTPQELARWQQEAAAVTITRDNWGIAHVHGATDAEAVFGMEYAQAEDDFNRVETNYINAIGELAQAEGPSQIWRDLRMKLFIDPAVMQQKYAASPAWLQKLDDAFADGLNYYLYTHPNVHPRVIHRFYPWMAYAFSEGSIGGDIERASLRSIAEFYGTQPGGIDPAATSIDRGHPARLRRAARSLPPQDRSAGGPDAPAPLPAYLPPHPGGSNGIAIAPKNTLDHHAILVINPHTSFYFRSELQMSSDQGLDAYGAVTWGQFFVYQGFNTRLGWMHTSAETTNNIDFYLETVSRRGDHYVYKYGDKELPVTQRVIEIPYKTAHGMAVRRFTAYWTRHGPVIGEVNGKWETIRLMQRPTRALEQDFLRTKALNFQQFQKTMELHTNSSNNTIYADADGNIAYWDSDFIPRRDPHFDWQKPVDGSNPATDWHGVLSLQETPHLFDPGTGWLYNSNNWPWSAAGPDSPKKADYAPYVDYARYESMRGLHALRVLTGIHDETVASVIQTIDFDSYQPWFARTLPTLLKDYDALPASDPMKTKLAGPIAELRNWNYRWGVDSIPTSIAVYWGRAMYRLTGREARARFEDDSTYVRGSARPEQLLQGLSEAVDLLTRNWGTYKVPWGKINVFQRLDDSINHPRFDDSLPGTPVMFTTATWGSLASFAPCRGLTTKRIYGCSGNSFVAVIDFGPKVTARAITAGGESGHPGSPHFKDEAERYATGNLRTVYFYPAQLKGHTERVYHPGEKPAYE